MLVKDPQDVLDYAIDWNRNAENAAAGSGFLQAGETISASTWAIQTITGDASPLAQAPTAPSESGGKTTIWLKDGTAGNRYEVVNHITTSQGRQRDKTLYIDVKHR